MAVLSWPLKFTCAVIVEFSGTLKGTCALICPADTKNSGAAKADDPAKKVNELPFRLVVSGTLSPSCVAEARLPPKALTSAPGAMAPLGAAAAAKLAPLTIEPAPRVGDVCATV